MTHDHDNGPKLYGLMAEFGTADDLIAATHKAKDAGYNRMDGYSPYPVGEVADALGFAMQYYLNGIDYPLNVGGKPFFSWPQFIPITWELLVLTASMSGLFGLLALCGLPQPYHPVFNVPQFARASMDRFFLVIETK